MVRVDLHADMVLNTKQWTGDRYRLALGIGGFLFALFLVQGLPYWDTDYSQYFAPGQDRSLLRLLVDWLSPFSTAENWGFLDRKAQFVLYKVWYRLAGYDPWPYALFKSACFAGLGVMIYSWALRVVPAATGGRQAALAAAAFFVVAPGPVAALVWLADFGPVAEFFFTILTFVLWQQIEATPTDWQALSPLDGPEQRRWLLRWSGLTLAVYLAYKTKADLKTIPAILAAYVLLVRRAQWKLFGLPIFAMLLLAVPWSRSAFTTLPPFVPGSSATTVGYAWQPARFEETREFLWSSQPYDFVASLHGGSVSLAGSLGPVLLPAMLAFLFWRMLQPSALAWTIRERRGRARLFVALWFAVILVSTSALPAINPFFRIRWSILLLTPGCILLGWVFGAFIESRARLPRWAAIGCIASFALQTGINLNRSIWHRRDLGQTMTSVDRAYAFVDEQFPHDELALWPGFLSYWYHLDASPAIRQRDVLGGPEDLAQRHTPNKTLVIAWSPSSWEQLDVVEQFSGCDGATLFESIVPCAPGAGAVLMRYIGPDPGYQAAAAAHAAGDPVTARRLYEEFLARHPGNLGARVQLGSLDDIAAAERVAREAPTPENYLNLSHQYCRHGRHRECVAAAEEALRLKPDFAAAYNNEAAGYEGLEMWDEAIRAASEAVRLEPDFALARNNLAWSLSRKALRDAR